VELATPRGSGGGTARRSRNATVQGYCQKKNSRRGVALGSNCGSGHLGVAFSTSRGVNLSW